MAHVCVGRNMEPAVCATHGGSQRARPADRPRSGETSDIGSGLLQEAPLTGGKIVVADQRAATSRQPVGQMTADNPAQPLTNAGISMRYTVADNRVASTM